MKPEKNSNTLLAITRSKAKMYEYDVPLKDHIEIPKNPASLFTLSIGMLGDAAVRIWSEQLNETDYAETRINLRFSAYFIDAFLQSRLNQDLNDYLTAIGSASYYLSDLQGSASVLASLIKDTNIDLGCQGLETLLIWILKGQYLNTPIFQEQLFSSFASEISTFVKSYYETGLGYEELSNSIINLRINVYANGTPRQLLFVDLISALLKKHYLNSTWYSLPRYTDIPIDGWRPTLTKKTFVRDLWPAQHLIGSNEVYRGKSAVIQMPTSAGKTKAIEIIIRSSFLSGRSNLAVIVAPFRALCNEIKNSLIYEFKNEDVSINEISDVMQLDYLLDEFLERKQILIVTPEKLVYVLRQSPELAQNIGLLVYDEGHQFDSGKRGVTYELLLTSLNALVPPNTQKILISAVIANASAVNEWLNPEDSKVIEGNDFIPTLRTVAFASWKIKLGRLEFVAPRDPDNHEFFVPRIIESKNLQLRGKERRIKEFPKRNSGPSIALYFGLKLVRNGSIAIFCGTKTIANSLCERLLDAFSRGLDFKKPSEYSDKEEVKLLHYLYLKHFDNFSTVTACSEIGVYSHHRNTPNGLRLAIEFALKEGLIKFVICTSTLAQGVNIPLRYLIVTSVNQGNQRMKIRDFHNLIGRAGRSGMHTEGSIIFADPEIYDNKNSDDESWRWERVKEFLDPDNSEPCGSSLLSLFEPLISDDRKYTYNLEILQFVESYFKDPVSLELLADQIKKDNSGLTSSLSGLNIQIKNKIDIITAIESYLLSYADISQGEELGNVVELAKSTFAYHLADDQNKLLLISLFELLTRNIYEQIEGDDKKKSFGKTLLGVTENLQIEALVQEIFDEINATTNFEDLFEKIWPILSKYIKNDTFLRCSSSDNLKTIGKQWINGKPFFDLFKTLEDNKVRLITGKTTREIKIEHVVDICESGFAFEGMLIVGAISEMCELLHPEEDSIIENLRQLQKYIKYGLGSDSEVSFYEIGFSDRVISAELGSMFPDVTNKAEAILALVSNQESVIKTLSKYPAYFQNVLNNILIR